ncbi:MAG: hypothetical protein BWX61_01413 [Bacteroidetes bacterium ADurb.Bin035]|nr:MAG: hypothetical protein BWX61_01413 [Bacteroidetes bacterium ADurb.Bin035]
MIAKNKIINCILPINISVIITILDAKDRLGVIPKVNPTVPKAENTSNIIFIKPRCGSKAHTKIVPMKIVNKEKTMITNAFCILLLPIERFLKIIFS